VRRETLPLIGNRAWVSLPAPCILPQASVAEAAIVMLSRSDEINGDVERQPNASRVMWAAKPCNPVANYNVPQGHAVSIFRVAQKVSECCLLMLGYFTVLT